MFKMSPRTVKYTLFALFFFVISISLIPSGGAVAQSSDSMKRRTLIAFGKCISSGVMDTDDAISDFGDLFKDNEDDRYFISVGLDYPGAKNGTANCKLIIKNAAAILDSSGTDWEKWFVKTVTGTHFSETEGDLPTSEMQSKLNTLRAANVAQLALLAQASTEEMQQRILPMVSLCYTFTPEGSESEALGEHDFSLEDKGSYFLKSKEDVFNSVTFFDGDTGGATPRMRVGDVTLGFGPLDVVITARFDPNASDFYPIGTDLAITGGQEFLDCAFIRENKDALFEGVEIGDDGSLETPDGPVGSPGGGGGGGGGSDEQGANANCMASSKGFGMAWILCPVYNIMETFMNKMLNYIADMMYSKLDESDVPGLRDAWANMRDIANVLFVFALLIVIIGQAVRGSW